MGEMVAIRVSPGRRVSGAVSDRVRASRAAAAESRAVVMRSRVECRRRRVYAKVRRVMSRFDVVERRLSLRPYQ